MGNAQSTRQKIEQIIENYTEANAIANSRSQCTQDIKVDARGAVFIDCNGFKVDQQCTAMSNANLDTVVKALQTATLDSESQQKAEGIAMAMNVSVTEHDMVTKTLNKLVANCESNANNVMDNVNTLDMRDMVFDCTNNPDANVLHVTQYGDAEASCVINQIVDMQQENASSASTLQKNIGLKLPDFMAVLGILVLVMLIPMLMPGKKKEQ